MEGEGEGDVVYGIAINAIVSPSLNHDIAHVFALPNITGIERGLLALGPG